MKTIEFPQKNESTLYN